MTDSLGRHLVECWFPSFLRVPSGRNFGAPLWLTPEQAQIVLDWYAVWPDGTFVFRRGSARRPKGWGKSPLLAALALAELAGPVQFAGFDRRCPRGHLLGELHPTPWVQIAAVSEDQTDNTYLALFNMVTMDDTAAALGIDVKRTKVFRPDGNGLLEPVTAAHGSREGQPITFAVLDETHLWTPRNGGTKLAATLRRNAAKMGGRTFESTNAFRPGERSVAEATHKAGERGQKGLLSAAREGPWVENLADKEAFKASAQVAYGDSAWVDLDRIFEDANDVDTTPSDARRFYLNQLVASEDDYVPAKMWESAAGVAGEPEPGATIVAGFDGARFHDATALIGCEVASGRLFRLGVWSKPDGADGWEVDRADVDQTVKRMFDRWNVWLLYADPPHWDSEVSDWIARYGDSAHGDRVKAFPTNSEQRMSQALKAFRSSCEAKELSHDGDPEFSEHVTNARLDVRIPAGAEDDPERHVWRIRKPVQALKIDGAVAGVLAWRARLDAVADGALEPEPPPRVHDWPDELVEATR